MIVDYFLNSISKIANAVSGATEEMKKEIYKKHSVLTQNDLENDISNQFKNETELDATVKTMFRMQDELNTLINADWKEQKDWDFQRAIMIELGELMDHYGYKWWKTQKTDIDQCKLEVIDIAHFYISHAIQDAHRKQYDIQSSVDDFYSALLSYDEGYKNEDVRVLIDDAIAEAATKKFDAEFLIYLMESFGVTPEELVDKYILKNTLNIFRAKNGYNTGEYIKVWNGKEDNVVLMEVYRDVDKTSPDLSKDLYNRLYEVYRHVA